MGYYWRGCVRMRCENGCEACQNIDGDYYYPCYGCVLGLDEENSSGSIGCKHTRKTIEKMLDEFREANEDEIIKQMGDFADFVKGDSY